MSNASCSSRPRYVETLDAPRMTLMGVGVELGRDPGRRLVLGECDHSHTRYEIDDGIRIPEAPGCQAGGTARNRPRSRRDSAQPRFPARQSSCLSQGPTG